jgi:hypothetical protein
MSCEGNGKEVKLVTLINEAFQRASGQASSPTAIKRRDYRWVWLLASVVITAAITYSLTRVVDSSQTTMVAVEQYDATLSKAAQNIADPAIDAPSIADPGIAASSVTPEPASEPERMSPRYESLYSEAERTRIAEREALANQTAPDLSSEIAGEGVQEAQMARSSPAESREARAVSALLEETERQLENARTVDSKLPRLEELSPQVRDQIATLLYSAHDYASDGVSRVMLNGTWYTTGDAIKGSLRLIEIQPDAIVLETSEGVQFVQPALSSWVNL